MTDKCTTLNLVTRIETVSRRTRASSRQSERTETTRREELGRGGFGALGTHEYLLENLVYLREDTHVLGKLIIIVFKDRWQNIRLARGAFGGCTLGHQVH